jgi:hypothetical protein
MTQKFLFDISVLKRIINEELLMKKKDNRIKIY